MKSLFVFVIAMSGFTFQSAEAADLNLPNSQSSTSETMPSDLLIRDRGMTCKNLEPISGAIGAGGLFKCAFTTPVDSILYPLKAVELTDETIGIALKCSKSFGEAELNHLLCLAPNSATPKPLNRSHRYRYRLVPNQFSPATERELTSYDCTFKGEMTANSFCTLAKTYVPTDANDSFSCVYGPAIYCDTINIDNELPALPPGF